MFIRIFRPRERKEFLFNVAHISKIEVEYSVEGSDGKNWSTTPQEGAVNPDTKRWYRVYIADEEILLASNPDDPVVSVIEDIYKNAIKG
ncbi:MAG: hypothetical protein ACLQU5_15450 [Isosphaeraceae bacterium]